MSPIDDSVISLQEITQETLWPVLKLEVSANQKHFVLAMEQVIDYVRTLPDAREMFTSYVPGDGNPGHAVWASSKPGKSSTMKMLCILVWKEMFR